MRRYDAPRAAFEQPLEYGDRQGRARARFGSTANFVDDHQRTAAGAREHISHPLQMRGKRRSVGCNRLLVANVGHYSIEPADRRPDSGGKLHPAVRHRNEQSDHLQRHGLAAHIRPADDQQARGLANLERLGDRAAAEERMTAAVHDDDRFLAEFRSDRIHRARRLRPWRRADRLPPGCPRCVRSRRRPRRLGLKTPRECAAPRVLLRCVTSARDCWRRGWRAARRIASVRSRSYRERCRETRRKTRP